jgi:hypothetical protein
VTQKAIPEPRWYKNSYFWIAAILFIIGVIGLPFLSGEEAIRDPGQKRESGLALMYFAGAALMLVNGLLSHRQYVQHYREAAGTGVSAQQPAAPGSPASTPQTGGPLNEEQS